VESLVAEESIPLSQPEKESLIVDIQHETFGLGPLEPLLSDPDISDILVNKYNQVYIEKFGKLQKVDMMFRDNNHLLQIIDRIVSKIGRRVDESSPYVDARLPDGSRVNAIIPPLCLDGPALSIRRFGVDPLKISDILAFGTLTQNMAKILEGCVKTKLNVLISGGTGTGKTTLLNILSAFIPHDERLITIEDSAELQLKQDHVVRLETRPPNIEGKGQVTQRDLVRNSLRMRPDRIIVGEVRGGEALDMLQAMNTGHDGSLSTIHANSARDALSRIETMVLMAGVDLPERAIREQIASAINLVIQLSRLTDGSRKIVNISEVTGMEGNTVVMQDIFVFKKKGVRPDGGVLGDFVPTGVRPWFMERFKISGFEVPEHLFDREIS
jgi:pilus assembly protein CpaF